MIGIIVIGIGLMVFLVYAMYAVLSKKPDGKQMLYGWIIAFIILVVGFLTMYSADGNFAYDPFWEYLIQ